jgi:hypothetical protein
MKKKNVTAGEASTISEASVKKNSVLKNIGIALKAWFKRYPSAWLLMPIYLILRIMTRLKTE